MLTLFTTAKPFQEHIGTIQRNALRSWKLLEPEAQVIVFGNEEGAASACRELGLEHEPEVARSERGVVRADAMFRRARELARNDVLCYANCDIVLTQDFRGAVERVRAWRSDFLMVGRRWDTEVTAPIDFSDAEWGRRLVALAKAEGIQRFYHNIDYFAFSRGIYEEIPGLVVGRVWWDHWMVWKALEAGAAVVDASEGVCAVHQNHDYAHVPLGWESVAKDEDARKNFELAGGKGHLRTIEDATFRMAAGEVVSNPLHWLAPARRRGRAALRAARGFLRTRVWHPLLNATRAARHAMGLKRDNVTPSGLQKRNRRHEMDS